MPRGATTADATLAEMMAERAAALPMPGTAPQPEARETADRDAAEGAASEVNRLLLACAWIGGYGFRRNVIERAAEAFNAPSLEVGIDMPRLVRACIAREKAETTHRVVMTVLAALALLALIPLFEDENPAFLVAVLVLAAVFHGVWRAYTHATARDLYRRDTYAPGDAAPGETQATGAVRLADRDVCGLAPNGQNLLVYAGFTPFAFAGLPTGGWAVSIDVSRPASGFGGNGEGAVVPFAEADLWEAIKAGLADSHLPGLSQRELLFAAGTDAAALPQGQAVEGVAQPKVELNDAQTRALLASHPNAVRRYLWTSVCAWRGELVVSGFWRCALQDRMLQVEMSRFVLPPLAKRYRKVDSLPSGPGSDFGQFLGGALLSPFVLVAAPVALLGQIQWALAMRFGGLRKNKAGAIKRDPLYDFGAARSLRVETMGDSFQHYFQKMDQQHIQHFQDKIVLETLVDFLEAHGVDTADLKETQTAIFNSGVIVQGGDITAQSLAVGDKARARTSVVNRAAALGGKGGAAA